MYQYVSYIMYHVSCSILIIDFCELVSYKNVFTVKGKRVSVPEVDQRWECLDAVSLRQNRVLELDHLNAETVALVI